MSETTRSRTYAELLETIDARAAGLPRPERVARLYRLISPLLDALEREDEEFVDEPALTTPEAVAGLRAASTGEPVDADTLHAYLTSIGLYYSEDQDEDRHVISQTAYAAAAWLRLLTGRELPTDPALAEDPEHPADGLLPEYAPSVFTQVVDLLAWSRSEQVYAVWEDVETDPDLRDLPAATRELEAMHRELAG